MTVNLDFKIYGDSFTNLVRDLFLECRINYAYDVFSCVTDNVEILKSILKGEKCFQGENTFFLKDCLNENILPEVMENLSYQNNEVEVFAFRRLFNVSDEDVLRILSRRKAKPFNKDSLASFGWITREGLIVETEFMLHDQLIAAMFPCFENPVRTVEQYWIRITGVQFQFRSTLQLTSEQKDTINKYYSVDRLNLQLSYFGNNDVVSNESASKLKFRYFV